MKRRDVLFGSSAVAALSSLPGCARAASAVIYVEDYRARGAGDRATIACAIAALTAHGGGTLEFEAGRTYRLGRIAAGDKVFVLRDIHRAELRGNGATLACETMAGQTHLFVIQRCSDLHLTDFNGVDQGADLRVEWKGMHFIQLETTAGPISRITIENIAVNGAVALFSCTGLADSPRTSGIRLKNLTAQNCYYGLSFQENGDDVVANMTTINCRRTYFPYGVRRHRIDLDIRHDGESLGADACILIKRYARDTADISVRARFHGVLAWSNLVNLSQEPPPGQTGVIEDVAVQLSIDITAADPNDAARLAFSAYRGGRPRAESKDIWRNIRLSGCFRQRGKSPVVYRTRVAHPVGVVMSEPRTGACI